MPVLHQQRNETGKMPVLPKMPVLLRCQFSDGSKSPPKAIAFTTSQKPTISCYLSLLA
ncbi:MAG: hypothetical protein F6K26_39285 [Moorea sp. SIO2I5]|nr:hypothetical protein [Moorena sp. SIO2I5]